MVSASLGYLAIVAVSVSMASFYRLLVVEFLKSAFKKPSKVLLLDGIKGHFTAEAPMEGFCLLQVGFSAIKWLVYSLRLQWPKLKQRLRSICRHRCKEFCVEEYIRDM
jgi:hypothetical protein